MGFDPELEGPKLMMLLYGVLAFAVVVGLLYVADGIPGLVRRLRAGRQAGEARPESRFMRHFREVLAGMGFLAPALILLAIGLIVPALRTVLLSFMDARSEHFVGLDNFKWLFSQPETRRVLLNTALWVAVVPTFATAIGLVYAVLVDRAKFESFAKSLIFLPMAISFVGASIIWKFVYAYRPEDSDQIGLLNQVLVWLGGKPQQFLLLPAPWNSLFLIVVLVWIQAGFAMVILSAAIKAIPTDITEAARLDGVTAWQMFWQVTIPSIRPALVVVLVTISIGTLKVFDIVRTMTGGQFDTSVTANEMYNYAFRYNENGKGAALAVVLFVLVTPIVFYQVRQLRRRRLESR